MLTKLGFHGKEDVVRFVSEKNVRLLNLCHIPEDGRLKSLSFAIGDERQLEEVLEFGERVDGSSLFSFIDPHKSDIYIMPKLGSAFVNPFSVFPALNVLCKYLGEDGEPLDVAPENLLLRAEGKLKSSTGVTLRALAELEFYIMAKEEHEPLFPALADRNYHESAPLSMFEHVRNDIMITLAAIGVEMKYGHSEVGRLVGKDGMVLEQHEIEFTPQSLVDMAETIAVAKWVVRNVCARYGVSVSFSPKVSLEHAGSGMHVHLCGLKGGKNIVENIHGELSTEGMNMIGGILKFAPSLAAFGNPIPVSYLRFLARKESPMSICWGARNRLALIRIPLWWSFKKREANNPCGKTFEYRASDAMANPFLLFAGLAVAVEFGLRNCEESFKIAEKLHLEESIKRSKKMETLPKSCSESAANLEQDREYYEAEGVFPKAVVDMTVKRLEAYEDEHLARMLEKEPQKTEKLMQTHLHYG